VLIVSAGALAGLSLEVAEQLDLHGLGVTVVDPRWLKPVAAGVVPLAREHRLVVTVEDGVRTGGFGSAVADQLREHDVPTPVLSFGLPDRFLDQGTRAQVLADCGLTSDDITRAVLERTSALWPCPAGAGVELSGTF
jgi:1-deoxy-D-xylulose-5-phosphate synthase